MNERVSAPLPEQSEIRSAESLFLALTPFQVFLACGHALSRFPGRRSELWIAAEFDAAAELAGVLESWPSSPFFSVEVLPSIHRQPSLGRRVLRACQQCTRIARRVRKAGYQAVHVFHDYAYQSQMALASAPEGALKICLEDGTNFYDSSPIPPTMGPLASRIRRLLLAPWWLDLEKMGTHPATGEIVVAYPELLSPLIARGKEVRPLDRAPFASAALRQLAELYCAGLGLEPERAARCEAVVLSAHSESAGDPERYGAALEQVCRAATERSREVAVKLHPRESSNDPFGLSQLPNVSVLPRGLGAEFFFLLAGEQIRLVAGSGSSALVSASWLLPAARIVYVEELLGLVDSTLRGAFSKLGIHLCRDARALESIPWSEDLVRAAGFKAPEEPRMAETPPSTSRAGTPRPLSMR